MTVSRDSISNLLDDLRGLRAGVFLVGNGVIPFLLAYYPFSGETDIPPFRTFAILFPFSWVAIADALRPKYSESFETPISRVRLFSFWLASFLLGVFGFVIQLAIVLSVIRPAEPDVELFLAALSVGVALHGALFIHCVTHFYNKNLFHSLLPLGLVVGTYFGPGAAFSEEYFWRIVFGPLIAVVAFTISFIVYTPSRANDSL